MPTRIVSLVVPPGLSIGFSASMLVCMAIAAAIIPSGSGKVAMTSSPFVRTTLPPFSVTASVISRKQVLMAASEASSPCVS